MSGLNLFIEPAGTVATLKTRPDAAVTTYVVFVKAYTDAGGKPFATWHSDLLEGAGATLVLEGIRGYELILRAVISGAANIQFDLSFNGTSVGEAVPLPALEGPVVERRWSIVVR